MTRQIIENTTVNYWGQTQDTKKIKDELFCDSNTIAQNGSSLAMSEKNDCVVRAFMVVLDLSYDKTHKWVTDNFNRVHRKGTYTGRYLTNVLGKRKNYKKISLFGVSPGRTYSFGKKELYNPKYKGKKTCYTVKSFMENYPKGRYFIIVKGHALALVDGVLYGNGSEQFNGFRRRIHYVVKVG